jgi:molecular chaperone DnaJ
MGLVVDVGDDMVIVNVGLKSEAVIPIEQFRNERGELEVKAGSQPGQVIRLRGRGVQKLRGGGRGDLLVHLKVTIPASLNDAERTLLTQFAAGRKDSAPEVGGLRDEESGGGFFNKLKDMFT